MTEVFGKDVDGLFFGLGRQFVADFPVHLREDQPLVTVSRGISDDVFVGRMAFDDQTAQHVDMFV